MSFVILNTDFVHSSWIQLPRCVFFVLAAIYKSIIPLRASICALYFFGKCTREHFLVWWVTPGQVTRVRALILLKKEKCCSVTKQETKVGAGEQIRANKPVLTTTCKSGLTDEAKDLQGKPYLKTLFRRCSSCIQAMFPDEIQFINRWWGKQNWFNGPLCLITSPSEQLLLTPSKTSGFPIYNKSLTLQ